MELQPLSFFMPTIIIHMFCFGLIAATLSKISWFNQYRKKFLVINHMVSLIYLLYFLWKTLSFHDLNPMHYPLTNVPATFETQNVFAFALGYTIYDSIALYIFQPFTVKDKSIHVGNDLLNYLHHGVGVIGLTFTITQTQDTYFMLQGITLQEISSVPYHIYRIMQYMECGPSKVDIINKVLFFISWGVLRCALGLHLEYYIWNKNISYYCLVFGGLALTWSLIWFCQMIGWVVNQFKKYFCPKQYRKNK
eukprot:859786_1